MDLTALNTVQALAHTMAVRQLSGGDTLFEAGQPGNSIFAVLTGKCSRSGRRAALKPSDQGRCSALALW